MEDNEEARRIWKIRDHIDEVERIKGKIMNLPEMDSMWISDTKDMHFHLVASWQLLKSCPRLEGHELESRTKDVQSYLELAKEKYVQVSSELEALSNNAAGTLSKELDRAFKYAADAIESTLEPYLPQKEENPPEKLIEKIEPTDYLIHCAVCGSSAAVFAVGEKEDGSKGIIFQGITSRRIFDYKLNKFILEYLEKESLRDVHEYLKDNTYQEDGLDSYCPDCDKTFCRTHYSPRVVYDEGFYDCTYGTCPEGHRRIIDD